jgi:hypothetical protein
VVQEQVARYVVSRTLTDPQFPDGTGVPALRLLESRPFRSGVALLRYSPG